MQSPASRLYRTTGAGISVSAALQVSVSALLFVARHCLMLRLLKSKDKSRLDFAVDIVPCSQPTTSAVLEGKLLVVNTSRLLTVNPKETTKEAPKRHLHTLVMQHGAEEKTLLQVVFAVVEEARDSGLTITMIKVSTNV